MASRHKIGLHTARLFKTITGNELPNLKGNYTNRYKSCYERQAQSEKVIEECNEQCKNHKQLTMEESTEQSCLVNGMTCQRLTSCEPDDCDSKIPEEVFHADTPAMSRRRNRDNFVAKTRHCYVYRGKKPTR
ncbi:hypothetical protein WA026_008368 [Henosepilachna vigintioctopunctata]|uniref:Uncharacterized protein n=1 Tax=Henosepilachna vigintioctopunctata TaxID=420089 RepID=A0AAW1UGQ8_9CUCU